MWEQPPGPHPAGPPRSSVLEPADLSLPVLGSRPWEDGASLPGALLAAAADLEGRAWRQPYTLGTWAWEICGACDSRACGPSYLLEASRFVRTGADSAGKGEVWPPGPVGSQVWGWWRRVPLLTDPALSHLEGGQWQRCPGSFSGGSLTAASACGPGSVISDLSTLHRAVPTAAGTPCLETQECGWSPRLKAVGDQSGLPSFPGVVQWGSRTSGFARVSQPLPRPLIGSAGEPDVFDRPQTRRKERGRRCGPCTQPVGTPGSLYSLRRALGGRAGFSPTTGPGSWGHWGCLLSSVPVPASLRNLRGGALDDDIRFFAGACAPRQGPGPWGVLSPPQPGSLSLPTVPSLLFLFSLLSAFLDKCAFSAAMGGLGLHCRGQGSGRGPRAPARSPGLSRAGGRAAITGEVWGPQPSPLAAGRRRFSAAGGLRPLFLLTVSSSRPVPAATRSRSTPPSSSLHSNLPD